MENNATYEHIIGELKSHSRLWKKVEDNLENISLSKTRIGNYGIFYNGVFTGMFIERSFVNEEEVYDAGWKINKNVMEH